MVCVSVCARECERVCVRALRGGYLSGGLGTSRPDCPGQGTQEQREQLELCRGHVSPWPFHFPPLSLGVGITPSVQSGVGGIWCGAVGWGWAQTTKIFLSFCFLPFAPILNAQEM